MMPEKSKSNPLHAGVVGLGMMGKGITACLLANGFRVTGLDREESRFSECREHVEGVFRELEEHLPADQAGELSKAASPHLRLTAELQDFASCDVIIECIVEDLEAKRGLFSRLESIVSEEAILASNTSALPISSLQQGMKHPGRIAGMHWGEPCHILRFLEVIQGEQTSVETAETLRRIGLECGKEVVMVRKDVRGFIANRLLYALLREAFHLLENGVGTVEDIDAAFRSDLGYWGGVAGPFRFLDITGVPGYLAVMRELLPELNRNTTAPESLRALVESGAEGIANGRGFYSYTPEQKKYWERALRDFAWAVRKFEEQTATDAESL